MLYRKRKNLRAESEIEEDDESAPPPPETPPTRIEGEGEWNKKGKTAPSNASAKGTMQCANKSLPELSRLSGFNSFFLSKFCTSTELT